MQVQRRGNYNVRNLDDAIGGARSTPAFVLIAASEDGAAPLLSAASLALLEELGGSVFQLCLSPGAELGVVGADCEYEVAVDDALTAAGVAPLPAG